MTERHRFLRGMVSWIGFNRSYLPFQAPRRPAGESKYTTLKMMSLAIDALFSFSAAPMRMATRFGLALLVPGMDSHTS
jgi:dolichol-phosphate mannosyltransferase